MNPFRWLQNIFTRATKVSGLHPRDPLLAAWFRGNPTAAGIDVDEYTALNYSAVFAAVRFYAETVGAFPLVLFERTAEQDVVKRAVKHSLYRTLLRRPNSEMTSQTFIETLQGHAVSWGNGHAEIEFSNAGEVLALWPLTPNRVRVEREDDGSIVYVVKLPNGRERRLPAYAVFHLPGLGFDGTQGYSVIRHAANSIALGMATEQYGASFFGNGGVPGGVLTHPGELGETGIETLRASWNAAHQGVSRAHRIAILEEGVTWQSIGIPPEDSQFLQTRQFQIVEIARWFNLPPHLLRDLSRATFSNIEDQGEDVLKYSLNPWLSRWENAIAWKLLRPDEQERYYADFDTTRLLRGNTAARYAAYNVGRQGGWLSINDIRRKEGEPPVDDSRADAYLFPLNSTPIGPGQPAEPKDETKDASAEE